MLFLFYIVIILSLGLTYIPYNKITIIQLSPLIGSTRLPSFPILQYISCFLVGVFFSEHKIIFNKKILFLSIVGSMYYLICVIITGLPPQRFPPCFYWIVGSYFPIYAYYLFSKKFGYANNFFIRFCSVLGRRTLICLVISNLCLFLSRRFIYFNLNKQISMFLLWYFILFVIIISFCFVFIKLIELKTKWH